MKNLLSKIFISLFILLTAFLLSCQEDVRELRDSDPWIVYGSERDGNIDVHAINPITKEKIFVAETNSSESIIRYDPHKDRIIFPLSNGILTEGKNDLFQAPNKTVPPSWSSKGKIVYSVETMKGGDLFIASLDGSNKIRITNNPEFERYPAYNSSGDKIVYAKQIESGWDLFMLDIATKEETRLTELENYVAHPSWSLDGKKIVFETMYEEQIEIAVLNLESGVVTRLTNRPGNDNMPSWAPDSYTIAFSSDIENDGNFEIWTIDIETREMRKWTDHAGYDGNPIFVPYSAIKEIINE